jgi:hypothetical protein
VLIQVAVMVGDHRCHAYVITSGPYTCGHVAADEQELASACHAKKVLQYITFCNKSRSAIISSRLATLAQSSGRNGWALVRLQLADDRKERREEEGRKHGRRAEQRKRRGGGLCWPAAPYAKRCWLVAQCQTIRSGHNIKFRMGGSTIALV